MGSSGSRAYLKRRTPQLSENLIPRWMWGFKKLSRVRYGAIKYNSALMLGVSL